VPCSISLSLRNPHGSKLSQAQIKPSTSVALPVAVKDMGTSPWPFRQVVLQGNFGYSVVHRIQETEANNQIVYNDAAAFPFARLKTWVVWEINGTREKDGNQAAFSPGLKYNLTPERFLAIALPVGLNSRTPRIGIGLQIQITLRSAETRQT
jgi:hypothetical protein